MSKRIYEALYPETRNGYGPGRGKKERKDFVAFTNNTAQSLGTSRRTVEQDVQIATKIPEPILSFSSFSTYIKSTTGQGAK